MMRRSQVFVGTAIAALVLAGCATMQIGSYVDRAAEFNRYRTYAWGPTDFFRTGDPRLDNNTFFQERVQAAVDRELSARGFEKVSSGAPDLLIHYHASVTQRVDISGADRQHGYCDECRPFVFDAGTLTLDLVDTRTNKLVWRGWAEGSLDGVINDQMWMEQRVDEAVARILEKLPRRLA
jgi:hypothetical protein